MPVLRAILWRGKRFEGANLDKPSWRHGHGHGQTFMAQTLTNLHGAMAMAMAKPSWRHELGANLDKPVVKS
jgi:hypothetical protein